MRPLKRVQRSSKIRVNIGFYHEQRPPGSIGEMNFTEVDVKSPERQDIISDNAPPIYLNDGLITRRDCA